MKKGMYENCFTHDKGNFIEKLEEVLPDQKATAQRKLTSRSQKKHYFYISLSYPEFICKTLFITEPRN